MILGQKRSRQYLFQSDGKGQKGIVTESTLDSSELELILSVVNWNSPNSNIERIFDVAGRSIIFDSPTRQSTGEDYLRGEFDGLQLIGADGCTLFAYATGSVKLPDELVIQPVNPQNHREELRHILELRDVNEQGTFEYHTRDYAPLHGMDESEARNRKEFTNALGQFEYNFRRDHKRLGFIPPSLAAEGIFPSLLDDDGNQLHFQVYRVPKLARIPQQQSDKYSFSQIEGLSSHLGRTSHLTGITLRNIHEQGIAYMDCHAGNFSLIETGNRYGLYITDLGSMADISKKAHSDNYKGFDLFMYLASIHRTLTSLFNPSRNPEVYKNQAMEIALFMQDITHITLSEYFKPERALEKGIAERDEHFKRYSNTLAALVVMVKLDDFVEAFNTRETYSAKGE